ncbi:MAG: hypothetical protein JKY53_01325 [Flavobacteriales bacterium]|nr:hypothetical protein [Flavobacteriales bacterium]
MIIEGDSGVVLQTFIHNDRLVYKLKGDSTFYKGYLNLKEYRENAVYIEGKLVGLEEISWVELPSPIGLSVGRFVFATGMYITSFYMIAIGSQRIKGYGNSDLGSQTLYKRQGRVWVSLGISILANATAIVVKNASKKIIAPPIGRIFIENDE